ncbi:MAG: hypothetical protein QJR07_20805, partial [Acetobacteraceae bacterium]|nr:hypothetical protein [Acetobacteraceae bacterium]
AQDQHTRRMINVRCRWCGAPLPPIERPAITAGWAQEAQRHLRDRHGLPPAVAWADVVHLVRQVGALLGWHEPNRTGSGIACPVCHGTGESTALVGGLQAPRVCPDCGGAGYRAPWAGLWPLEEAAS